MALLKGELGRLLRLMDKMEKPAADSWVRADVWADESEVVVRFEVPGAAADQLRLLGTPVSLEISGIRGPAQTPPGGGYLIAERRLGPFRRAVELPVPVDLSQVQARLKGGVMTVVLRKVVDRRMRRHQLPFTVEE